MSSRSTSLKQLTPLEAALPGAQFGERHARVVDADAERVWAALHTVRWRDLTVTAPLVVLRLGPGGSRRDARMVDHGPGAPVASRPPNTMTSAVVARPWKPVPQMGPVMADLAALRAFDEAGWLKFGMEWTLSPVAGGRTLVETTTLCEATDEVARRRFARYWAVIRPFSGLIRRDLLGVVDRLARSEQP